MNAIADEINSQIAAGRKSIERSLSEIRELDVKRVPPGAYVAAGMVGVLALGMVGWMIYRRSRRRSLAQQLQEELPDTVRELPARARKLRAE